MELHEGKHWTENKDGYIFYFEYDLFQSEYLALYKLQFSNIQFIEYLKNYEQFYEAIYAGETEPIMDDFIEDDEILKIINLLHNKILEFEVNNIEPKKTKQRYTDINFKFALLEEMKVIEWLNKNIPTNNEMRADILMELIGGSKTTLVDYLKGKTINKDVKQKAIDFINERRYPK